MAFERTIDVTPLDGINGYIIFGDIDEESADIVSNAGDINGDGYDDFLIHCPWNGPPGGYDGYGSVTVVFGKAGGFPRSQYLNTITLPTGFQVATASPSEMRGIGDMNGDGFDDFAMAYFSSVDIIFGKPLGFEQIFDPRTLDGENGFSIRDQPSRSSLFISISGAGDVNGDGFDDFLFARGGNSPDGLEEAGQVFVVFGSDDVFPADLDVASLNGANGFAINGLGAFDQLGYGVAIVGDVNGDGIDDLAVSAPGAGPEGAEYGETYIVFGTEVGFAASFDVSSLDGSNGYTIFGETTDLRAGFTVEGLGDINGDGADDMILNVNGTDVYVVFGSDEGQPARLSLSDIEGTNGFRIRTIDSGLGLIDMKAGDINGDGLDDIVLREPGADNRDVENGGKVHVIFGSRDSFGAEFDLQSLDGTNGFRVRGYKSNAYFANTASAGDHNGDGYVDLIIGARWAGNYEGESYIIFGKTSNQTEGTDGDDILDGARGNDELNGYAGNDRLNGGDGDDIMRGGAGDDQYFVSNAGDVVIEFADEGSDTVTSSLGYVLGDYVENLRLRGDADYGIGNKLDNVIVSVAAGALLSGGRGNDFLRGSEFGETISGDKDNDELQGRGGDDLLFGGEGDDLLRGDNGDDWLSGGAGWDTMRGGAGADTFAFADGDFAGLTVSTADRIAGFRSAEGDVIDLSAVDAITATAEDDAFTFIGDEDFSGTAGELRWEFDGNRTMLYMDTDGDGAADHAIRLNGIVNLTEADIVL